MTAALILLSGTAVTVALCWPVGLLAEALQGPVDTPMFRLVRQHQHAGWTTINDAVTRMGDRPQVKLVALVAAVLLTVLWRRRQWWLPALFIAAAYLLERESQLVLQWLVARPHPPTFDGGYPSGGVARVLAVYGTVALLCLPRTGTARARRTRWTLAALSAVALLEGYTRIYLMRHWATDVAGGLLLGYLLLTVLHVATVTLTEPARRLSIPATARWLHPH